MNSHRLLRFGTLFFLLAIVCVISFSFLSTYTSVEYYHFSSNGSNELTECWIQKADMPTEKEQFGFEELNGILYAIGGDDCDSVDLKTNYAYNISTNNWSIETPLPFSAFGGAEGAQSPILRAVNDKLYFIGGLYRISDKSYYSREVWEYNPKNNKWTRKTDMPTGREDMGSAVIGNNIHVFGGLVSIFGDRITEKHEVYNTSTDTWETKADLNTPVRWSGDFGCACNGKIYTISGCYNRVYHLVPLYDVNEYDVINNIWTSKTDIPTARGYKEAEEVNGKIYVMSGAISTNPKWVYTKKNEVYDCFNDTWKTKTDTPYGARGVGLTSHNNLIYFCGGYNNGVIKQLWVYNHAIDKKI